MTQTTCPFPGCGGEVGDTIYLCTKHWLKLTKSERELMWEAHRERGTPGELERFNAVILSLKTREPVLVGEG